MPVEIALERFHSDDQTSASASAMISPPRGAWLSMSGSGFARESSAARLARVTTAPCDAPLLPRDLFWRLLDAIGSSAAAFATTASGEHPLCAVWDVRLREPLQRALEGGVHPSVRSFLNTQGAQAVRFDDARAFANANTADALATLERSA